MTSRSRFGAALAAGALLAGCAHAPVSAPRPLSAPKAASTAKSSKYLMIQYITGNGMMGTNFTIKEGEQLWLRAQAWDTDNRPITYNWSGFGVMGGFGETATFWGSTPGSYMVNLNVRDDKGNSDWRMLTITVEKRPSGTAPAPKP